MALVNSIANALTSFGIPTTVTVYPSSEFSTIIQKGQYDLIFLYYDGAPEPGLPSFFPEGPIPAAYYQGYPFNATHWNMVITLPNGTQVSPLQVCYKYFISPAKTFSCYAISMWAWNHYVPFIQIDRNTEIFFLNTQYVNWPINDTSIWDNIPSIQTEAWTALLTHVSFKSPSAVTTVTTTSSTTTPSTVTKVVTPSYIIYAVVAVVVVVVIAAVVAIILMRRR